MKIAVCFSGQMRTAIDNFENIKKLLGEMYEYCDFFVHTWNNCEYKTFNASNIKRRPIIEDSEKVYNIEKLYKPKIFHIENIEHSPGYQISNLYGVPPLWYSFMKSVEYKQKYEKDNGFEYDCVLKLRFDFASCSENFLKNEIETTVSDKFKILGFVMNDLLPTDPVATDMLFVAKSKEMNIASTYFWEIVKNHDKNIFINFPFFLINNGIKPINTDFINEFSILRSEFANRIKKFVNFEEMYKEILKFEVYYYDTPIDKNTKYFIHFLKEKLESKNFFLDENKTYYLEDIEDMLGEKIEKII
jgi:hypothetical protein